ncbi:unnamed protein product [Mytilus coruscus]|uniref:Reverse transcriptase domain-containing protein n=1 Tax=Mytilus coruscus TaxID=42192 RepID=A0A6J8DGW9_MYTCO|nr:unnamed protein product [Mytilus coruscus]
MDKSVQINKSQSVVKELGIQINENLDMYEKQQLTELLTRNRQIFAKDISELGKTEYNYHRIDTGDAPPVQSMPYRQTPQMREETEKHIDMMLQNDIIEPSSSPWASPVVLVRKKKNNKDAKQEFRFAVDYRRLNKCTLRTKFCIPRVDDVFDTVANSKTVIYSVLDLMSGFFQTPLDPETKHKSAFVTHQVYTDNITLRWIDTIKNIQGRLGRWALELQGYDFQIMHRPGKNNNADALSRREYEQQGPTFYPHTEAEETVASLIDNNYEIITFDYEGDEEQQLNILAITDNADDDTLEDIDPEQFKHKTFRHLQRHCPDYVEIFNYKLNGQVPQERQKARQHDD